MQPLITSKLTAPPVPPHALRRSRLLDILTQQLPHVRLALVAAPAGYGKTTLLAQWARQSASPPVAWLSLDEGDDALERFFRYLLAAWDHVQPGVMESPLGVLLGSSMPGSEALLSAFLNLALERQARIVFVLDDYHLITDPAIHQAMTFLVDHLPPVLSFVLACRGEPPLPLARYRARRQLLELRPAELHFSSAETGEFLRQSQGLKLAQEEIKRLQQQSEGWVAGLQLAALSLQRRSAAGQEGPGVSRASGGRRTGDEQQRPVTLSGSHRFIADYLAQDVLAQQPADVRDFLLRTAILKRMSAALCAAILGDEAENAVDNAQQMLERLERDNLFLAPLDDQRRWFRYHHLFAEFLQEEGQRRFSAQTLATLHRRAAAWHLAHDVPQPAFEHAVAAGDLPLVTRVIERYFFQKLHAGELRQATRWLDALPHAWFKAYPTLTLARAGVYAFTGALDDCFRCVQEVERELSPPENDEERRHLARATAVRCFIACFRDDMAQAEDYAGQALLALSPDDLTFRADTYVALGDIYRRHGRWQEAERCYRQVLQLGPALTLSEIAPHAYGALADLELRQGHLRRAAANWRQALQSIEEPQNWGHVPLTVSGWVHVRLGEILYEWNELDEAQALLSRGLQRAELGGDLRAQLAGALLAGRLALARGEPDTAGEYLEQARPFLEKALYDEAQSHYERLQLQVWLAHNQLRAASSWADEAVPPEGKTLSSDEYLRVLAVARLRLVAGDQASVREASRLLSQVQEAVEASGRLGLLVEALALQALAHRRHGDDASALTALERALRLAQPEGYTRLFVDLGLPMARLLQEAQARNMLPDLLPDLLNAFEDAPLLPGAGVEPLPEPLTPREQEVLELLAAGLTNREIGEQLVISPQTVKKHAGNIYGKLGAGNRTEAVARARELQLL